MGSDADSPCLMEGRLADGLKAKAYRRTVLREIPSSRVLPRSETPCSLACCTAIQRAC